MELKPDYKNSEIGPIPVDWQAVAAGEVGRFRGGSGFPTKYQGASTGTYPFFKVSDMNNEGNETFMRAANNYIDEPLRRLLGATAFPAKSIAFAKVGAAVFLERKKILAQPSCLDNNMAALVLDEDRADYRFVHHWLLHIKLAALVSTTALPSLNGGVLREVALPLPPLPEQRAIAAALSDVDALLARLDQLIAKRRDLKQAAMQQLLTGQTRLPGFSGEWMVRRLGELGEFLKGRGVTRDQSQGGPLPCLRYGEIYTTHQDVIRSFTSWISADVAATATRLKRGDILFAGSGETKEEIGKCVAFVDDIEAFAGGDIVILRPRQASSLFLGYALNAPAVNRQKASRGQGDAVVHISATALADVVVAIPDVAEQAAIANILADIDAELTALAARREKTRALKQGMMQELLTGRIRLV